MAEHARHALTWRLPPPTLPFFPRIATVSCNLFRFVDPHLDILSVITVRFWSSSAQPLFSAKKSSSRGVAAHQLAYRLREPIWRDVTTSAMPSPAPPQSMARP